MRLIREVSSARHKGWIGLLLIGAFAASGCSDGKIRRYLVNGTVNVDGTPVAGVMVIFCPVGGSEELQKLRPSGFTEADGKFQLTSVMKADGAPAGQYKVLMNWPAQARGPSRDGNVEMGPDRLQGRYMNLEKCQFTVEVKSGSNDLPPFELKSR
jgi:hypothetical protein